MTTKTKTGKNQALKPSGPLSSQAYSTLKSMILDGELQVGVYYLEQDLAARLGISRTPLKEALVKLENERLIHIQPRHGMQILPISADDMVEIYQIITSLECEAVYNLASNGLSDANIASLMETATAMEAALDGDDMSEWARADEDFHRLVLELCGNKRLKQTVLSFWDQAHRARYLTLGFRDKPVNSTRDHNAVIEAIKVGDVERATDIHRKHRIEGGKSIVAILRRMNM